MRTVVVVYHQDEGEWWADSPDVRGFTAGDQSLDETRRLVQEGLEFYLDDTEFELDERYDPVLIEFAAEAVGVMISKPHPAVHTVEPEVHLPSIDLGVVNAA